MLTKAWGAHKNGYQTPAFPPHTETPAWYSLYFKPFCWSGSPVCPTCLEPGTCQQHTPRKSVEDAFLQPPSLPPLLHRICLQHDTGSLLLSHYDSALHSSFLTKGMSHHGAGTAPHQGGLQQPLCQAQRSPFQHMPPSPAVLRYDC